MHDFFKSEQWREMSFIFAFILLLLAWKFAIEGLIE